MSGFVGVSVFVRLVDRCAHDKGAAFDALHGKIDAVDGYFQALQ